MVEPKVSLNLFVQGAGLLSSQECEKNPKDSYDVSKVTVEFIKGKGKSAKKMKQTLVVKTRKQQLISQHLNICKDAYEFMLATPSEVKLARVWMNLPKSERLKKHLDHIAHDLHAVSYTYEVLED